MTIIVTAITLFVAVAVAQFPSRHPNHRHRLSSECLVSSLIDTTATGVLPYPVFYDLEHFNIDTGLRKSSNLSSYVCGKNGLLANPVEAIYLKREKSTWFDRLKGSTDNITCSAHMCPMRKENLVFPLKVLNWSIAVDALFDLAQEPILSTGSHQGSRNHTRVPVRRVIALGGSVTLGRGSNGFCCSRTMVLNGSCDIESNRHGSQHPMINDVWYCNWFGFLAQWFRAKFPSQNFHFHNMAIGGTGSSVMATEVNFLFSTQNITLTSRDIVFTDFSSNDGPVDDIEPLIRAILQLSKDEHGAPTIIIIENLIWKKNIYRNVARYYNLPLYSYKEVLSNPLDGQSEIFNWISQMELHVPWHAHLLLADTLASFLTHLLHQCQVVSTNAPRHFDALSRNRSTQHVVMPPSLKKYTLPSALNLASTYRHAPCNIQNYTYHTFAPNTTYQPESMGLFEQSLNGWTAAIDRRPPAAWINNNYKARNDSERAKEALVFGISTFDAIRGTILVLRLKYLKTYKNGGAIKVNLCGLQVFDLDSLSGEGNGDALSHVSVAQVHTYEFTHTDFILCRALPREERVVQIQMSPGNYGRVAFRENFKFNLYSVTVCYIDKGRR